MNKKTFKKIRLLVLSAKGWNTGSALRAFYIAEAFKAKNHSVTFVKPIPTMPLWFDMILSTLYYLLFAFKKADAVLVVKPYPTVSPLLWIQKKLGAKIIIDIDDLDFAYSKGWFRKIHAAIQKPIPTQADWVTYHHPQLKNVIQKFFNVPNEKIISLPQGVQFNRFNTLPLVWADLPSELEAIVRNHHFEPLFCFSAHLNVACDLSYVLKAFKIVKLKHKKALLIVAGGGPDQSKFEKQADQLSISDSVFFTGLLKPQQVMACMKASHRVLVYYSKTEANEHRASLKLREALVCGTQVVATQSSETGPLQKHIFISEATPETFAHAMQLSLTTKKLPKLTASIKKSWDWINCINSLERHLAE